MKFQVFSDLHLELKDSFYMIPKIADYLILAGDIGKYTEESSTPYKNFMSYCSNTWLKVIYVLGNHEFYSGHSMSTMIQKYRDYCSTFPNVYLLYDSYIVIEDYYIYGFTGWTLPMFNNVYEAKKHLNDYNYIRTINGRYNLSDQTKLSNDQLNKFKQFIDLINMCPDINNVMVVTHFSPIKEALNPRRNNTLDKYYAWDNLLNDNDIICSKIKYWCYGHTHWSQDITIDNIRYIANQIGYECEHVKYDVLYYQD